MTSLAFRHREKALAKKLAAAAALASAVPEKKTRADKAAGGNLYQTMLAAISVALGELKSLKSIAERIEAKRSRYLPQFAEYIEALLVSGQPQHTNLVLVWYTIWLFDTSNIEAGLRLAQVCIDQGQPMPNGFNSDMKTFVADSVYDWSKLQFDNKQSAEPYFSTVLELVLGSTYEVHEKVQIKFAKLSGDFLFALDELQQALDMYRRAQAIDGGTAGVATRIANIEKELTKRSA